MSMVPVDTIPRDTIPLMLFVKKIHQMIPTIQILSNNFKMPILKIYVKNVLYILEKEACRNENDAWYHYINNLVYIVVLRSRSRSRKEPQGAASFARSRSRSHNAMRLRLRRLRLRQWY
jgi:hypothetical protein